MERTGTICRAICKHRHWNTASALELALALELASILHMYNEACKTDQGGGGLCDCALRYLFAFYCNCVCSK